MRSARLALILSAIALVAALLPIGAGPTGAEAHGKPDTVAAGETASHPCPAPFPDVGCANPFWGQIAWMVDAGITTGYPDGTYRPQTALTRQGIAAFLYRLAGEPPGPFPDPGFSDVPPTHPFYDAIAWLAHSGITTGYPDGTYRPAALVARQGIAAFLYRLAGEPPGPFPDPGFSDVPPTHPFYDAIAWLAHSGITTGYPDGTYRPAALVARQAIAAFLHRERLVETIELDAAGRCEFLDPEHCLLPFPSDHLTVSDDEVDRPVGTSETGIRLNIAEESMPTNTAGTPADPTPLNMNDGFSPGQKIVLRVPEIDLETTGAPPITDLERALDEGAPVLIIDTVTGERVPLLVELDENAEDDDRRALIIRPTVNFQESHRHVIALRNLRDAEGSLIAPSLPFRTYRDHMTTGIEAVEARRAAMEEIFALLEGAGVDRNELYLAWDFTVASEVNLSERILHMRDDAFGGLGADAPAFTVTQVDHNINPTIARRIRGTLEVPRYLEGTGGPGSRMHFGPDGLPAQAGVQTANLDCIIPSSATAEDPARLSLFGHGLLGSASSVLGFSLVADRYNTAFCATDWIGMSSSDIPTVIGILQDLSEFAIIPDRAQQGFLNFLFLGRLMIHSDGFAADPNFQDAEGDPIIDTSDLVYIGGSQGGIMGGALTAVAQDFTHAVLAVPGMNYSTMLRRSSNWPSFETFMRMNYPDELDQTLGVSMIQILWDRGESNGYAHHMVTDTYPGTPEKRILLFEAFGDHQVANLATETMARTIGASVRQPALGADRSPILDQFWGIPAVPSFPFAGSVLVMWDWGSAAPPLGNIPPSTGPDPHGWVGNAGEIAAQDMLFHFLSEGELVDVCGGAPCTSPHP